MTRSYLMSHERQALAVGVLVAVAPRGAHGLLCPASIHRLGKPDQCDCWVIENSRRQAAALDAAGQLVRRPERVA